MKIDWVEKQEQIHTSAIEDAAAAAACVLCDSSRRKRPNLRTPTEIGGTTTKANTEHALG